MGTHFKNLIKSNLAQYDTAEVYVSEVTMLEMTDKIVNDIDDRMEYQAIEIFFVEMLLLQDAAVSRMHDKVKKAIETEKDNPLNSNAKELMSELLHETTDVINFTDYKQFYYPTVRISAENVSKAFGIDGIRNKYYRSKSLLSQLTEDHKQAIEKKENLIKNSLLVILTILSGIETVSAAFNFITGEVYKHFSYYIAIGAMFIGISVYFIVNTIAKKKLLKKIRKRNVFIENDEK